MDLKLFYFRNVTEPIMHIVICQTIAWLFDCAETIGTMADSVKAPQAAHELKCYRHSVCLLILSGLALSLLYNKHMHIGKKMPL